MKKPRPEIHITKVTLPDEEAMIRITQAIGNLGLARMRQEGEEKEKQGASQQKKKD